MDKDKVFAQLKKAFEENPLQVISIGSLAAMAGAKLLNAFTHRREIRRREYNDYRSPRSHR